MRKNWTAFKNLQKHNQIFRIINLVVMALLCLACVALAFYYGFVYDPNNRIVPAICIAILSLVPLAIEGIFGRRFNNVVFLSIEIYLIFAGLIGSVLNVYYLVSWYDIVIHILMGYLVAMCGIFVISRLGNYKKMSVVLVIFFCFCFSLAIEVLWEIFEWGADNLFNQTMQGEKLPGVNQPLVGDTMLDLVCNTTGATIFFFHFVIGKFSKKSLGINFIEKQLIREDVLLEQNLTYKSQAENSVENGMQIKENAVKAEKETDFTGKQEDKTKENVEQTKEITKEDKDNKNAEQKQENKKLTKNQSNKKTIQNKNQTKKTNKSQQKSSK